uniref:ABC transporter n=1 Tax=Salvia miltiorrhiza TaxID=226208 RepID=A0A8E7D9L2_SALMI|nr:ABC transporter [Salvia miltiorrhiza]
MGDEQRTSISGKVPYHKLFSLADGADQALMLVGAITAVGSGLSMPLMTLIFGDLANAFAHNVETKTVAQQVAKLSLKYVYLAVGSGVATFSQVSCWMITGERQAARIRNLYLRAVLRQDVGYFDTEVKTGEIMERISNDSLIIQDAMSEKVGKFIQLSTSFLGGIVIAFIKGWLLASILLSVIPLLIISAALMTFLISKLTARGQFAYSKAAVVVEQTIISIRDVRNNYLLNPWLLLVTRISQMQVASFTGERRAVARYDKSLHGAYEAGVQIGLAAGVGSGIFMLLLFCSYALAIWFGAIMIVEKGYTGGDVLNVTLAIVMGSFSVGLVTPCLSAFAAGQTAAFKLFETMQREPTIDPYNTNGLMLNDMNGDVELRDVHFSYPSRPNERVLAGFSLEVPCGTTLALVGESGSGKSTVINLVERFYDPQLGEVLIDGINIKEFQVKWLRGKIGLVSQEPVLFALSIKENISYGKSDATLTQIRMAAQAANAANFIDKLPQGLDTVVGGNGTQLSGGQKQRIALARAILKDAKILLLDEATSALDAESERVVQEALDRVLINRTTLVVAHRLSTVKNADSIAVIHQGKIVEKGLKTNAAATYIYSYTFSSVSTRIFVFATQVHILSCCKLLEGVYNHLVKLQETASKDSTTTQNSMSAHAAEKKTAETPPPSSSLPKLENRALLVHLSKPELPQLVLGSLCAAVNGATLPLYGLLFSGAIKSLYEPPHELQKQSRFWAIMLVTLGLASLITTPLKSYLFAVAGCKLIRRVRLMCFHKLVHMDIGWFERPQNSSSKLGSRLSADAASLRSLVGDSLALLVHNTSTAIAGFIIAFGASWELSLLVLPMLPLIGLNGYLHMKFISGFAADTKVAYLRTSSHDISTIIYNSKTIFFLTRKKLYEEATQVASEAVGSIRTVASLCGEDKVAELYREKCRVPVRLGSKQGVVSGASFGLSLFLLYSVYAASYYAGARLVDAGKINFGDVFRVFLGLSMTATAISQSSALAPDSGKAKAGAASIFALLHQKPDIDSCSNSGTRLESIKGDIVFHNVTFAYPTRPGVEIFKDLCFAIHSGKREINDHLVAAEVLRPEFRRDNDRRRRNPRAELEMAEAANGSGGVEEPALFNDTIRANIAYGKGDGEEEATEAEIVAAARLSNAHAFISGMDEGYETNVGERGIQLSGGQKQRVAIARAIVKAPRILLLDEATSALDAESERAVQGAFMAGTTTLVVAHRLSTIKNADLILVLRDGVVVERGNHQSLINDNKHGVYASLLALHSAS